MTRETREDDRDEIAEHKAEEATTETPRKKSWRSREFWRVTAISLLCLVLLIGAVTGYMYASSPVAIRQPLLEHYHFRMQVLVDGKAEKFGDAKYQTGYSKDNCNVALPNMPIHFHDSKDQFVHIHWEGTTGGQVLKYYGWNFIGGINGSLGYRFDTFPRLHNVAIHGKVLPNIPDADKLYVYTGDTAGYKARTIDEFTGQDLEKFFGVTSNFPAHKLNQEKRKTSLLDNLKQWAFPTANALSSGDAAVPGSPTPTTRSDSSSTDTGAPKVDNSLLHTDSSTTAPTADMGHGSMHSAEELKHINNLLGNVVIFVQKDKPTDQQIKDRFNKLLPLTDSVCGG